MLSTHRPVAFAYITSADILCKSCMQFSNKCGSKQHEILQQNACTQGNTLFLHCLGKEKYKHQCLPCFPQQRGSFSTDVL